MKKINIPLKWPLLTALLVFLVFIMPSCSKNAELRSPVETAAQQRTGAAAAALAGTVTTPYKVAYYAFDHNGPRIHLFAPDANIVILFEGTPFEMADSAHYGSANSYMFTNANYKSYKAILNDVRALQAKGVKVLWNIDDAVAWQTAAPFKDYRGTGLTAAQYAALVKACVIDSLHMDGIALDQEHISPYSTTPNANYLNVLNSLSSYFGLTSSNPSAIFTTASGADVAYCIQPMQNNPAYAANMNFVMDQGYGTTNAYRVSTRLPPFANIPNFGWPKTMTGVNTENGSGQLPQDIVSAQWQPSGSYKAGIMVYAANGDTAYAGKVFRAVSPNSGGGGTTAGVQFFQDAYYGGTATQLIPKGNYTLANFATYGMVNDWASSVTIPSGWTVIMYADDNFSGTSWTLTSSNNWFGALSPNANDKVSSFKIQ